MRSLFSTAHLFPLLSKFPITTSAEFYPVSHPKVKMSSKTLMPYFLQSINMLAVVNQYGFAATSILASSGEKSSTKGA